MKAKKTAALSSTVVLLFASLASAAWAEPVKIGVGIDAAFAPIFLAQHRGLFAKAGVDATVQKFSQGGEAMDALAAGMVQISSASDQTSLIRMSRADLKPLAIYEESGTYIKLVARPGIASVKDVKKFGVVKGTVSAYSTFLALKKDGVDPTTVQMVPAGPPELPALLARGDVDAFFAWEPWPGIAVKQGAKVLATSGDVGYAYTMWAVANGPWLADHRDEAGKILKALAEAADQIVADPEAAAKDLQAETKLPAADTIGFLKETKWKVRDFGEKDLKLFDGIVGFMVEQKIVPTPVPYRDGLQFGFYKE